MMNINLLLAINKFFILRIDYGSQSFKNVSHYIHAWNKNSFWAVVRLKLTQFS
jgi:hypothetical protein